ncbi:MAG TPA: MEDS domain-containing protein [Solirubrobacteraceae bacterium]|jgi:anti-sigma regulatory factor (Ser/Thr protein kinase)|nr:MEDS domain-containing protein [Solirubrobacteraceae bacterium]
MAVAAEDLALDVGEHVVQLYEHDHELAQTVGRHLAAAIEAGDVVVVLATEPHRQAFEAELAAAGVDVARAVQERALVSLDAAATLASLMPQGRIDAGAFERVVGTVVREAAESGRKVRAYGELVCLLWDAGDVMSAIELEQLWNELSRAARFSLVCAYRSPPLAGSEHAQAFAEICHLHSSVHPSPGLADANCSTLPAAGEIARRFPVDASSPRAARRLVAEALRAWGHDSVLVERAQIVVSELATNALIHARTPFSVLVATDGPRVRISVSDASPIEPTLRDRDTSAPSGRGLQLVAALTSRWGVELGDQEKTVWAEVGAVTASAP